jgi:type VI secretion system secreted protein VgrG
LLQKDFSPAVLSGSTLAKGALLEVKISGLRIYDGLRIEGAEGLSQSFEFSLWIRLEEGETLPSDIVGKEAHIALMGRKKSSEGGLKPLRHYHGLIAHAEQASTVEDKKKPYIWVRLTLRPAFWFLSLSQDSRTYQEKSAHEILKELLHEKGIAFKDKTESAGRSKRTFCVQYQESYFSFMSRLMEKEGISYYYEYSQSKHTLVLIDDNAHFKHFGQHVEYSESTAGQTLLPNRLWSFQQNYMTAVSEFSVNNYLFENPLTPLLSSYPHRRETKVPEHIAFYSHPESYHEEEEGHSLAKKYLEACNSQKNFFRGVSTYANLSPGMYFKLKDHPIKAFNGKDYVVVSLRFAYGIASSESLQTWDNTFEAIEKDTPFKTPLITPKVPPVGPVPAKVTGKPEEEIWVNEHRWIKVKFYWDHRAENNETSSCWVPVVTPWSGNNFGINFPFRVGQDVLIGFMEGDPSRPFVLGAFYNKNNMSPYHTPEDITKSAIKTHSTKKGESEEYNLILFTDEKEREKLFFQAQKDMETRIKNNQTTTIDKGDRHVTLSGKEGGDEGKGDDFLTLKKGSRTVDLCAEGEEKANLTTKLKRGNHILTITEGNHEITIDKGDQKISLKDGSQEVSLDLGGRKVKMLKDDSLTIEEGHLSIEVKAGKISIKGTSGITMETPAIMALKCSNFNLEASAGISIKAGAEFSAEAGAAMSLKGGAEFSAAGGGAVSVKGGGEVSVQAGGMISTQSSVAMINS